MFLTSTWCGTWRGRGRLGHLISQGLSAVLSYGVFMHLIHELGSAPGYFSQTQLGKMTAIALPSILQQSIVSIGMMLVQGW